ncbi:MAG: LysR family transcriptional regulator [Castellaniella sp.]|uniref:LysR family transcriptional regulator n=1 Tax=Castellaniella sp. TaxID=1955812 RepID=UPI00121558D9|nr:LysR family transcriptional regulator [Castellaniella sp.]TAN25121.1 MAG: LysR family transcriptional regulator [Castellaniella sp.]
MLRELKTFLAVVHYGTFEKAGTKIGLTQSAVSGHIRRLEELLGHPLFDRAGRGAVLNAFGRQTFPRAKHIVDEIQKLNFGAKYVRNPASYKFGAIYSETSWLMRSLAAVRDKYPETSFQVVPGASHDLTGQVHAGNIDFAVIIRPPYQLPAELQWVPLGFEPYVLLAPKALKLTQPLEILRTHPFIRYDTRSYGGMQVDSFLRRHYVQVSDAVEIDDLAGLVKGVSSGLGVAIVAAIERIMPFPENTRALSLGAFKLQREIGILRGVHFASDPVIECLMQIFVQQADLTFTRVRRHLEKIYEPSP